MCPGLPPWKAGISGANAEWENNNREHVVLLDNAANMKAGITGAGV
jgi:hypothetical protein